MLSGKTRVIIKNAGLLPAETDQGVAAEGGISAEFFDMIKIPGQIAWEKPRLRHDGNTGRGDL